jgi:ABC-type uncharacterized transport system involved in gliding motility auxiliary subunit
MSSYQRSSLAVVLILLITFCGTFLVSEWTRSLGRVDTTETGVYSLSEGTGRILARLQKPLTMKFFYSKDLVDRLGVDQLRDLNNYYYYVRDLLRTYERSSGGKLRLVEFDPQPFSDAEQEADRLKIRRIWDVQDAGLYFGMAVTSETGAEEAIDLFDPRNQSQVEYQVSEAIELATKPKKKTLGVLSSLDITGGGMTDMMRQMMQMQGRPVTEPWGIVEMLRRFYEVSDVAADATEIDPELDYLLVVQPKGLSEGTLYAIDQFVMRGGKLIACVDPFAPIGDPAPRDPQNPFGGGHDSSSSLNRLLEAWGVTVPADKFVGDQNLMQAMPTRRGRTNLVTFLDLNLQAGGGEGLGINPDEPVARGLARQLLAYFPGSVQAAAEVPDGVTFAPFLRTTAEGNAFAVGDRYMLSMPGGPDPQRINADFRPGASPVAIAGRITGVLPSAFPGGKPSSPEADEDADPAEDEPAETDEAKDEAHLATSTEPNTVVVIADVDMLADGLCFQRALGALLPITSNPDFVVNVIDFVAGSTDLMSVRSRGKFDRPFTVIDEIERRADLDTQQKVAAINADIQAFEQELSGMRSQADETNVGVLRGEAMQKQQDLERQIREKRRELDRVQKQKNDEIESLETTTRVLNTVGLPLVVLVVGLLLAVARRGKSARLSHGGAA